MRIPDLKQVTHHFTSWRIGMYVGLSIPALVSVIQFLSDVSRRQAVPYTNDLVQIYAGFSVPIVFLFLFALNEYGWSMASINYRFIFEFDPRDNLNYHEFTELGGILLLLWSYAVYISFLNPFGSSDTLRQYTAVIFLSVVVAFILNPIKIFYYTSRRWMLETLWRVVTAPYHAVEFRDFFIADELTSMVYFLTSLQLFVCVYSNDFVDTAAQCNVSANFYSPAINMLPAYFRLMQCLRRYHDTRAAFPHLANAGKYSLVILTAWLSTVYNSQRDVASLVFWVLSSIITTCYAYSWDVLMDWGLF